MISYLLDEAEFVSLQPPISSIVGISGMVDLLR